MPNYQTLEMALLQVQEQRPMSLRQLRRWVETLNIKPLGAKQRPQPYPADTAARVLAHLGIVDQVLAKPCDHKFIDSNSCLKCGWTPTQEDKDKANGRIVSLDELKAERSKAAKARRVK